MSHQKFSLVITLVVLMVLTGAFPLLAGDPARIGTASGVQVQVPVGPRGLAMSGSNLATISGLEAMYWNPAGLATMDNRAAGTLSTMTIFNDIDVNYLGLAVDMGKYGTLGYSLKAFDFGDIPVTTNQDMDGASGQTFSPTFVTTGLTYSKRLTDAISFGLNSKIIHESIPRASATAVAFDFGIQYHQLGGISGLSMGVAIKNIGSDIQYTGSAFLNDDFNELPTASHNLPATVELALGYRYDIAEENSLYLGGNFQNENLGDDAFRFGVEYNYSDFVFLRGGYLMSQAETDDQLYTFTAGLGLMTDVGGTDLGIDYAFRDSQYFDGNHLFGLTVGF